MKQKNRNCNRHSEEVELKMIELYDKYKNLGKVARELNLYSTSVSRVLKRKGIKIEPNAVGDKHPGWKGGKNMAKGDGYIGIWTPGHERADGGKYVYEHTLVFEKHNGRLPNKNEVLHHIDLDKHNNNISNLFLCGYKEHTKIHRQMDKLIKPLMDKGILVFDNGQYKLTI